MTPAGTVVYEQLIGPVRGRFLACQTIASAAGYFARAMIHPHEPTASCFDGELPEVVVGPLDNARIATQMVVSRATWEIDNGIDGAQGPD